MPGVLTCAADVARCSEINDESSLLSVTGVLLCILLASYVPQWAYEFTTGLRASPMDYVHVVMDCSLARLKVLHTTADI